MKIKKSTIILIAIIVAYTVLSFYRLGSMKNPQTYYNLKNTEQLIYVLPDNTIPTRMMFYSGNDLPYISIFLTNDINDLNSYKYDSSYDSVYVFSWHDVSFNDDKTSYKYVVLQSYWDSTTLGELKIYDQDNNEIKLEPFHEKEKVLLDEQDTVPTEYSYYNSSYFDEVYFPRAAYEILNGLPVYETVHPPLGKLIISIPVSILGVTPFAYRLMGNIAGILMLIVIYAIAKELLKKELYAIFAVAIMALDGMHFVQTRIGTVDSFLVLFIMASFLFFIKYLKIPKEEKLKKKVIPLLISGTFWGMAISTKWTAAFAGLGMGIIYAIDFIKNKKWNIKLLLFSVLSFVIIPFTIYILSYIPIINNPNEGIYDIKSFIEYQQDIYNYHSGLQEGHPYSSPWYTWPIIGKPLWFYAGYFSDGKYGTIACMGNPAIWWLSILTAVITLIYTAFKKNKEGLMIIIMIFATWLPYFFISRAMFIYHYFITLPFMMLTIPFAISKLAEWKNKFKYAVPVLCVIFLAMFIYFYPVYSGLPVNYRYIEQTRWFKEWFY